MHTLQTIIDDAFLHRDQLSSQNLPNELNSAILTTIDLLDTGKLRLCEKHNGQWITHEWLKKAILLFFKTQNNTVIDGQFTYFFDKVPLKFSDATQLQTNGVRIVPPACARKGAYIAPNTVLMPCYINIGAYVDTGVMVDTWATVGSCAQIGKNVHLSGGVGIGGVLEPG